MKKLLIILFAVLPFFTGCKDNQKDYTDLVNLMIIYPNPEVSPNTIREEFSGDALTEILTEYLPRCDAYEDTLYVYSDYEKNPNPVVINEITQIDKHTYTATATLIDNPVNIEFTIDSSGKINYFKRTFPNSEVGGKYYVGGD
jgi:hypothetical protein